MFKVGRFLGARKIRTGGKRDKKAALEKYFGKIILLYSGDTLLHDQSRSYGRTFTSESNDPSTILQSRRANVSLRGEEETGHDRKPKWPIYRGTEKENVRNVCYISTA